MGDQGARDRGVREGGQSLSSSKCAMKNTLKCFLSILNHSAGLEMRTLFVFLSRIVLTFERILKSFPATTKDQTISR